MKKPNHWDKIYKNYIKGGEAYASLSHGIMPEFVKFIDNNKFTVKSAFDIGCGNGKYLKFLEARGFETKGIDNSKTAVSMSKKSVKGKIILADMFNWKFPKNSFDLIISIAALHHGYKEQIKKAVNNSYHSLVEGGLFFVTLPADDIKHKWKSFKTHEELASGVITPVSGPEAGLPHSLYLKKEVKELFKKFETVKINKDNRDRWVISGKKKV